METHVTHPTCNLGEIENIYQIVWSNSIDQTEPVTRQVGLWTIIRKYQLSIKSVEKNDIWWCGLVILAGV